VVPTTPLRSLRCVPAAVWVLLPSYSAQPGGVRGAHKRGRRAHQQHPVQVRVANDCRALEVVRGLGAATRCKTATLNASRAGATCRVPIALRPLAASSSSLTACST
jgi:hypothetical protein